jgi:4'-phosphopantetheinyl transferase
MELGADEVHVWEIDLDTEMEASALSGDERTRAAGFKFEIHRRRFIHGRAVLRKILGAYLNRNPGDIFFDYGPAGKPGLQGADLDFNLAHTDGMALLGVARRGRIGVDIELIREMNDMANVAAYAFAPGEVKRWRALPMADRTAAFHRCWTRKEAYLKATGEGVAQRLHSLEVAFEPATAARILSGAEGEWTLADVSREPIYAAAFAVEGGPVGIRKFDATEWLRKI